MNLGLGVRRALLSTGSLLFFLVLAELVFRPLEPDRFYVWPPHYQRTFHVEPGVIHGVRSPSTLTINGLGMRGDPMGDGHRYRILTVGASTTICVYLDDSVAWPHRVQERLNATLGSGSVWVGNVGRPGHNTHLNALQLEKLLSQYPEIDAATFLLGAADLLIHMSSSLNPGMLRVATAKRRTRSPLAAAFGAFPGWDDTAPWYLRNTLGRVWRIVSWEPVRGLPTMDTTGVFVTQQRLLRTQADEYLESAPPLEAALAAYVRSVGRLADIAQEAGVRPIFITQPSLWDPGLAEAEQRLLWGGGPPMGHKELGNAYYSVAVLAQTMEQYNEALLGFCGSRGVECIDAAPQVPRNSEMFYDDAHYTETGSERMTTIVSEYLLRTPPLDPAGSGPGNAAARSTKRNDGSSPSV